MAESRRKLKVFLVWMAAASSCLTAVPPLSAVESPFDNPKSATKKLSGPVATQAEKEEARRHFAEADVVLSADIKSVTLDRMGFGGPPVPTARVLFENVTALKGERPPTEKTGYLYKGAPEALDKYRGRTVLAALARREGKSELFVTGVFSASPAYYEMLDAAAAGEKCADEPAPSCGGKTPARPA